MAGTIREIKGRIRAVGNIQRITKTMQMISTARFQAMQRRATSAQAYTRKIAELVGELAAASRGEEVTHPLLAPPEPAAGRRLLLVLSSDRGLAGAYNANVLRRAMRYLGEHGQAGTDVEVVGKKGLGFFRFNEVEVAHHHDEFGDTPEIPLIHELADRYMEAFASGRYDAIDVAYTAFRSMSRQEVDVAQLLPLEPPSAEQGAEPSTQYDYTPDPATLLTELLPMTVKAKLLQQFNEAVVSEHLARMVAMKAATDAAAKMQKNLQTQFNRARQDAITTELNEIIGGAEALA
ncbi:MAG: ATP synthase F1 subunit gamma [Phycisphaeraceae bacterium]